MPDNDLGEEDDGVYVVYEDLGLSVVRAKAPGLMAVIRTKGSGKIPAEFLGMFTEIRFVEEAISRYRARTVHEEATKKIVKKLTPRQPNDPPMVLPGSNDPNQGNAAAGA